MIRIDASEYSEKHSISRLIGSPPGYVGYDAGGQLTEYVRRKPYSIILVDEVEKACREFVTLFLQVLDDGRLTDGQGRIVDFRNTVILMTSNLGAAYLNDMGEGPVKPATKSLVMGAIQTHFPPEFINRIDEIVIFVRVLDWLVSLIVDILVTVARAFSEKHAENRGSSSSRGRGAPFGQEDQVGHRRGEQELSCICWVFADIWGSTSEPYDPNRAFEPAGGDAPFGTGAGGRNCTGAVQWVAESD